MKLLEIAIRGTIGSIVRKWRENSLIRICIKVYLFAAVVGLAVHAFYAGPTQILEEFLKLVNETRGLGDIILVVTIVLAPFPLHHAYEVKEYMEENEGVSLDEAWELTASEQSVD